MLRSIACKLTKIRGNQKQINQKNQGLIIQREQIKKIIHLLINCLSFKLYHNSIKMEDQPLFSLLQYIAACRERLKPFKLTYLNLRMIFEEVDVLNKGFLNVEDVFQFLNKNVKEDELFYLMKELSYSRSGIITLEDLFQIAGDYANQYSKLRKRSPKEELYQFLQIMKANFEKIETKKRQLGLCEQKLVEIYEKISTFGLNNGHMDVNMIIEYIFRKKDINIPTVNQLKIIFRKLSTISSERFCLAFLPISFNFIKEAPQNKEQEYTEQGIQTEQMKQDQTKEERKQRILKQELIRAEYLKKRKNFHKKYEVKPNKSFNIEVQRKMVFQRQDKRQKILKRAQREVNNKIKQLQMKILSYKVNSYQ